MLWKISVMRMAQEVKRETSNVKRVPEVWVSCMTVESVNVERYTSLFPCCDRPATALRRSGHAPNWVDHQRMSDQLKKVVIAGAVAVCIGPGEVEIHSFERG